MMITIMFMAILGDGEMQEGQIWESFITNFLHYKLDNLIVIIRL